MLFSDLGIRAELLRAVESQGYREPTPIQIKAIPTILAGRDVLASAQTGTGKTAAFLLPVLQRLAAGSKEQQRKGAKPRALVLTPTRELAAQVMGNARDYGRHLALSTTSIFGGVSIRPQFDALRRGVDIVIATPGRLLDHLQQGTIDLSRIETLILDEADRMLDMGFIRDIRRIGKYLPTKRQTLLFSATFSSDIRKLAADFLHQPEEIAANPENTAAERVEQIVWPVDKGRKRELLAHRIGAGNWRQVLVFTRTKHGADRLTRQLTQDGLSAAAIHGRKTQGARTRALADFKAGKTRILVATDIAARGLDIERLPHVVNYELPEVPEDYVHRIGRTARAGEDGQAISLVCPEENKLLAGIERLLSKRLERELIPGYECRDSETGGGGKEARPQPRQNRPGNNATRTRKSKRRGGVNSRANNNRSGGKTR